MASDHAGQPSPLLGDGQMPALLQQGVDLGQLGPHPLRDGLALDPETAVLRLPTDVGEAEEIERLGLADTPGRSLPGSVLPELDQAGLVRMQLQVELPEPFAKIGEEPLRIGLVLETGDQIIGLCRVPDYAEVGVGVVVSGLGGGGCSA